jgi:F plasmid transfer operon protein TraF
MRAFRVIQARLFVSALLLGSSGIAGAQVANASTAATGLSGAFTARATGYNAIAWNPANLAMPGNPGFSFTLGAVDGSAGIRPIDLSAIGPYAKKCDASSPNCNFVPASVREQWMVQVAADSGQKGAVGGGITELGLSLGSLAFQANTKVATDMNLAPDAVEALLFGNAGRTGTVKKLNLAGSRMQAAAYSTGAVSYALPLAKLVPLANFAVGVTAKYTIGHGILLGQDNGSSLDTSSISLNFPAILSNPDSISKGSGSGMGFDLGAAWSLPGLRVGVTVQNLVNTFKWDTTKLVVRDETGKFDQTGGSFSKDTVNKPFSSAPQALRDRITALKFKPVMAAGVAFDLLPMMTVSADVRQQAGDGIEVGPKSLVAAGIEYRIIPFVPLRAGASVMTGGYGVSGGVGLHFLGFEMGVAGFLRKRDGGTESGGTLNVISIRP